MTVAVTWLRLNFFNLQFQEMNFWIGDKSLSSDLSWAGLEYCTYYYTRPNHQAAQVRGYGAAAPRPRATVRTQLCAELSERSERVGRSTT